MKNVQATIQFLLGILTLPPFASVLVAEDADGKLRPVRVDRSGNLAMASQEGVILASSERIASVNGADLLNPGARGVLVLVDATVEPAARPEISIVTALDDVAGSLNGKYFLLTDDTASVEVWLNVDSGGTAPGVGTRAIEVAISEDDDAATIAAAIAAAVHADSKFNATALGDVVTITDASNGPRVDVAAGNAGFTVATFQQGSGGTASVVFKIQGKDPASGAYYDILESAAVAGVETRILRVHPDLTASPNLIAKDILPKTWRVIATAGDADPLTYSVGYSTLP